MLKLAIHGGSPVRQTMLPYATQSIDAEDHAAIREVLDSGWLTTGPLVAAFERDLCAVTGAQYAVAVNTGTAALHAACSAAGVGSGDEVIVPAISFAASASCVLFQRATPVFADLCPDTLNIDPEDVARKVTSKTRAIVAVDFTGHPCDHDALRDVADGLPVIEDAAHALGAQYKGRPVGTLQRYTALSFHPVKHVTTGEGGAILTNDPASARHMRSFRHHGIDFDFQERGERQSWEYDINSLGYNYRIPDINCALGISQLKKSVTWLARRKELVALYTELLKDVPCVETPHVRGDCDPAWHLYVVRLNLERLCATRGEVFTALRAENIGVNVHYIPIPWMSLYANMGYKRGQWPVAEREYGRMLTLPLFPGMHNKDVEDVVVALQKVTNAYGK